MLGPWERCLPIRAAMEFDLEFAGLLAFDLGVLLVLLLFAEIAS
jgi:hypothetical protein